MKKAPTAHSLADNHTAVAAGTIPSTVMKTLEISGMRVIEEGGPGHTIMIDCKK